MNPKPFFLSLPLVSFFAVACNPSSVDETGYLRPPDIDTTSEEPLDDEELRQVVVVGNPGAVEVPGGLLRVTSSSGDTNSLIVDDAEGSFVTTVAAIAGDTLLLNYDLVGEDEVEIELSGTAAREAPGCGNCFAEFFSAPNAEGKTEVDLTIFIDPSPPYTLFNQDRAIAVRTNSVGIIAIAAESGERVCIYESDEAATSATLCALVP